MYKKIYSMVDYIGWLIQKHNELQQKPIFRLINITKNKFNEEILHIQIANKAAIFQCKPSEIIPYDNLLDGFSKKDIRTITYLATKSKYRPTTHIVAQRFCDSLKRFLIKIKRKNTHVIEEISASTLSKNKAILNSLSQEEAHRVGFLSAMEQFDLEQEKINSARFSK